MEAVNLHPAQEKIAEDTHRFRVVNCGRRFGKTTLAVLEIVAKSCLNKDIKIAYIAPTYTQARDIAWSEFKRRLPEQSSAKPVYNESRLEITLNNKSHIWLRGWESIESLRGQSFDFLIIDEVAMMRNFWEAWQEVVRPTLTDRKGEVMFISTPKGFNHFYDLYNLETKDKDYKSFHFTSYDNPFIPKEEIDKAKIEITDDRFHQEYLADFRKSEGLVYKEFLRDIHTFTALPEFFYQRQKILGLDFGYTNPCGMLDIKTDGDDNLWITGEYYKRGKTDTEIAAVAKQYEPNVVYPDPENPAGIKELRNIGLNVREVIKGKKSVENGIQMVREAFKQGKIKIHQDCINLIYELETYSYPDKKPDKNESENPIPVNDHLLDALRYVVMTHAGGSTKAKSYNPMISYRRI